MRTDAQRERDNAYAREYRRRSDTRITYERKRRAEHRERLNAEVRARNYGLTVPEMNALLAKPCAICGAPSQDIDHDHTANRARAALCHPCNVGIGMLGDDANRLLSAAAYLISHEQVFSCV